MTPSNPATFFVNGSEERKFRYLPGPHPYYVIIRGSSYIPLSVMVFASDGKHALEIIKQMIDFKQACLDERRRVDVAEGNRNLRGSEQHMIDTLREALVGEGGFIVHCAMADPGQLYKIGWASNDTL